MVGLLYLVVLFQYSLGSIISALFGWDASLTLRLLALFGIFFSIFQFIRKHRSLTKQQLKLRSNAMIIFAVIAVSLFLTALFFGGLNKMMRTYLLSFFSKGLSGMLLGFCAVSDDLFAKVIKWVQPYCLFLSVCLLVCTRSNAGKWLLDYTISSQTLSYSAAYVFILLLFSIANFDKDISFRFFNKKIWYLLDWIFLALNIYVVFAGGGRGAFVLIVISMVYFIYLMCSEGRIEKKNLRKILIISVVCVIGVLVISRSEDFSYGFHAIERLITKGFTDASSLERIRLYKCAIDSSSNYLYMGAGFGSTAYLVGYYTHNIFMDILVDAGFIGCLISLILIIKTIVCGLKHGKKNVNVQFCFFIFICVFTFLMFSGFWMEEPMLWFSIIGIRMISYGKALKRG